MVNTNPNNLSVIKYQDVYVNFRQFISTIYEISNIKLQKILNKVSFYFYFDFLFYIESSSCTLSF